ncbi:hypothetical protein [Tepidanaerobacter syntrophicus]|uniref:Lipoprotein n=1 Tax=Tepidanaerobacter syntrophicus TaxID=224999 RepID=A0A0U9HD88_9FIRM|nr:hypothetical protein [Tepidanaerobacter syntrophicus]GAQ24770.1 hypothetical protein TSYNT_6150 [Tepidanaerobacter syntrophicus]
MNRLKLVGKLSIFMLVALMILTGCSKGDSASPGTSNTQNNPSGTKETSSQEDSVVLPVQNTDDEDTQDDSKNGDDVNTEEEPAFNIEEAEQIEGWKKIIVKDYAYVTEDWVSYSFRENSPIISYSLEFPSQWKVEYSIFTDENGEKIGELLPPVMMKEGQTLLDTWKPSDDYELISKEDIKVGELTGVKIITKSYPYGGDIDVWYPHTYYLTDGKRVFIISFYTLDIDLQKQELFDKIISTFKFLD